MRSTTAGVWSVLRSIKSSARAALAPCCSVSVTVPTRDRERLEAEAFGARNEREAVDGMPSDRRRTTLAGVLARHMPQAWDVTGRVLPLLQGGVLLQQREMVERLTPFTNRK
jgi:hypothetical protein